MSIDIYSQAARIDFGEPAVVQKEGKPKVHEFFTYCDCGYCKVHLENESNPNEDPDGFARSKERITNLKAQSHRRIDD